MSVCKFKIMRSRAKTLTVMVQKPGYIPKKPSGFLWVDPPKKPA